MFHDFPIRGQEVLLHVRRRRWLDADGHNVMTECNLIQRSMPNPHTFTGDPEKLSPFSKKMAIVWRKVTFFSTFRHTIATFSKKTCIFAPSLYKTPEYMKYCDSIVGRKHEQDILQMCYDSPKAEFVAVYGRRRIGKTGMKLSLCCRIL